MECFDLDHVVNSLETLLGVRPQQIRAAIALLEDGNTLPFIARYRKEATQGLDENALRTIEDTMLRMRELAARKSTILKTIEEQGLLTAELRNQIVDCHDRQTLEDMYLPYKPRRRTRATIARERGLQELADIISGKIPLTEPKRDLIQRFVSAANDVPNADAAVQGACDIIAEQWSEDAETRAWLTDQCQRFGKVHSQVKRGKKTEGAKFESYFDHTEPVSRIRSHRFLAMKRGESEGFLKIGIQLNDEIVLRKLASRLAPNHNFVFHTTLADTVKDCYTRLLLPSVESAIFQTLKEAADEDAIEVFAKNLRELLLAAPAGAQCTIGLDPGFRTGCKLAVVDGTGKFLQSETIYPTPPRNDLAGARRVLLRLIAQHGVQLIAIGNGTASREADKFVSDVIREEPIDVTKVVVNESGASIYSASELAVHEYPDLDVTVRGAISIAHRLQDPLAELVKIDPKSIGVGQYQHDVNQARLRKALEREVESCVNSVGVELNQASPSLLSHVAGIGPKLAERIVSFREERGKFKERSELMEVPKLGKKAFQQAAGFLRIREGSEPLDQSAVHPESYYVVKNMARSLGISPTQLVGSESQVQRLNPEEFVDDRSGLPTITDILEELRKPGRDPRKDFQSVSFKEGVNELADLKSNMILEGVVTNVTHFGAFVDLGVHQDGLIHISQISNELLQDPSEVLSVGDRVRVQVMEVDIDRKRIALSRKALL